MKEYKIVEPMPQYGKDVARIVYVPDEMIKQIRTNAIDDFAKYIREKVLFEERWLVDCKSSNANTNIAFSSIMTFINSVAEELKKVEIQ